MRGLAAGVQLQLALLRRTPGDLLAMATAPLFTLMFLAIVRHAGRVDLTAYAVLAPAVIAMLGMALLTSGEVIEADRANGTLELALASPTPLPVVVLGRVLTVTVVSTLVVGESWLAAFLGFRVRVAVPHGTIFVMTLVVTVLAMAGTATALSGIFVLARSARTFQNSLTYPLYLLGGAIVPVALLPAALQPFGRLVFLSWSTDLLRETLSPAPVTDLFPRLGAIVGLGAAGYLAGLWLIAMVVRRVRRSGTVSYS